MHGFIITGKTGMRGTRIRSHHGNGLWIGPGVGSMGTKGIGSGGVSGPIEFQLGAVTRRVVIVNR